MEKKRSLKGKIDSALYDHPNVRMGLRDATALIVMVVSAFIFALSYKCFLNPTALLAATEEVNDIAKPLAVRLVSGGVSGVSQMIIMLISLFPGNFIDAYAQAETIAYAVLYFGLNIPIFIVAWRGVGKRFAFLTLVNVGLVSAFTNILGIWDNGWVGEIAMFAHKNGGMLTRMFLAAVCTGISSGIAFKADGSAGGIDVISYFIALKKGVLVGKYSVFINAVTITLFTLFGSLKIWLGQLPESEFIDGMQYISGALFSVGYLIVTAFVIDRINLRNKKMKITAISENMDLGKIIIANIPHGATMMRGQGAFSGRDKGIFEFVVSSYEVKTTVKAILETDPNAFVQVEELKQVFGRFFTPPVK